MKERDYLFDNIRAYLIFFVVFGHMIREQVYKSSLLFSIYTFVYLFHMAAFIFISGYFSKNTEKCRDKAFETLLLPFIILDVLSYIKGSLFHEITGSFKLLKPQWGLWFFLALFTWRFLLKDIVKIRFILPVSFAVALLSGFTSIATEKMSIGRIVAFFPFFLLGFYCNKEMIEKIRKIPKIIPVSVILALSGFSVLNWKYRLVSFESLYLRRALKPDPAPWYLTSEFHQRIFIYIAAILLTASFICLVSKKHTKYSYIGQNSITVYMVHIFLVPTLKRFSFFDGKPQLYFFYSLIIAILITTIASLPVFKKGYDGIMNLVIKIIFKKPAPENKIIER